MTSPAIIQSISAEGANPNTTSVHFIAGTFASKTTAQNAIIAFRTVSDFAGIHADLTCTDTQNNFYRFIGQGNTNPGGGAQTLAGFYTLNIAGDSSTGETVTSGFTLGNDVEDFQALYILEIGGVSPVSAVVSSINVQNALSSGTNNVTSGSMTVTAAMVPCFMVALSMNTSGHGTPVAPTVGTGMVSVANCWGFFTGTNTATVATQAITTPGTYSALFNQGSSAAEDMVTAAIVVSNMPAFLLNGRLPS